MNAFKDITTRRLRYDLAGWEEQLLRVHRLSQPTDALEAKCRAGRAELTRRGHVIFAENDPRGFNAVSMTSEDNPGEVRRREQCRVVKQYPAYYVVIVQGKIPKERLVHKDLHCQAGKGGPPNMYCLDEIQHWARHHAEIGPTATHGVLELDDTSPRRFVQPRLQGVRMSGELHPSTPGIALTPHRTYAPPTLSTCMSEVR